MKGIIFLFLLSSLFSYPAYAQQSAVSNESPVGTLEDSGDLASFPGRVWLVFTDYAYPGGVAIVKLPMKTISGCEAAGIKLVEGNKTAKYRCVREQ